MQQYYILIVLKEALDIGRNQRSLLLECLEIPVFFAQQNLCLHNVDIL